LATDGPITIGAHTTGPNLTIFEPVNKSMSGSANNRVNFDKSTLLVKTGSYQLGFGEQTIASSSSLSLKSASSMYFNSSGYYYFNSPSNGTLFRINSNGNVGIGTSPSQKLDVAGSIRAKLGNWIGVGDGSPSQIGSTRIFMHAIEKSAYIDFKDNLSFRADNPNVCPLTLQGDGNVAIGYSTSYATDGSQYRTEGHKLAVNGSVLIKGDLETEGVIKATEIIVEANDNTADFVFESDYHLLDLSEVENFIKINKHLPEIPSAAQMEKQGVNLAEMNKLLLQKVEELTLYSIGLEKARKIEQGEREKLEERLERIEKLLTK